MAAGNVTISLPQMIDLALNVPEHGSVNFNLLQSVLHVLVQQLELVQCKIEFRGKDGEKVQNLMTAVKPETTIKITEYVVSPAKDAGKVLNRKTPRKGGQAEATEGAINIGQVGSQENLETIVVVEPGVEGGEDAYLPCIVSKKCLQELDAEINTLKARVQELAELPGNTALIEALRGSGIEKGTPILDMFHIMTLAKKLEAAESGVEKLASMVEDLAKQGSMGEVQIPGVTSVGEALGNIQSRLRNIEMFLDTGGSGGFVPGPSGTPGSSPPPTGGAPVTPGGPGSPQSAKVPGTPGATPTPGSTPGGTTAGTPEAYTIDTTVPDFSKMSTEEFALAVQKELRKIKEDIKHIYDKLGMFARLSEEFSPEEIFGAFKNVIKKHKQNISGTVGDGADLPAGERLERLEDRFNGTDEQLASLDSTFNQEINNLHGQFAEMEKAFGTIMEKIHFGMPGGDSAVAGETLGELYDKLMGLQSDMDNLAETASKLVEDKEDKQRLLEVLTEQVEFLKTVKADKEDLEDALADKADACAINRKVSHDQFDTACDELSKGIEEALAKLTQQEELWQQALNEIQKEIGNKLDRMELGPLRDFVNNKLKMLQQRLKALTALKQETEAAGTKKFLRNVNCISCDKDVVMRKEMDPSLLPQPYALPPSRSMGPYLAYELDALRKQQKSLPNSRNLNHFENALQQKSPRPGEDHICNRYCGGSHTITTPQQRVTRLGHFLNQWGPEAQAVGETPTTPKGISKQADSKLAVVGTSNIVQTQEDSMPKVSRVESADRKENMKHRKSSIPGEARKHSISEKRKSSAQRLSVVGSPKGSPKGSTEGVEKRRSSASGSATKVPSKRLSQGSATGSLHKEGSQLPTTQEETPSEVAKEEEGVAPLSPEGEVPLDESKQASSGQVAPAPVSERTSITQKSKSSQQALAKSSSKTAEGEAPTEVSPEAPAEAPAETPAETPADAPASPTEE